MGEFEYSSSKTTALVHFQVTSKPMLPRDSLLIGFFLLSGAQVPLHLFGLLPVQRQAVH